jgi:hypothetical protein
MRAEKLDPRSQFREILREVGERGECVVDTGSTLYALRPHAVEELERLLNIIEGLDYSVLLPGKAATCIGCVHRRARLLSRAVGLAEEGRLEEARIALRDVPRRGEEPCGACVEEFRRETAPLTGYSFRLREIDFTSSPYLTSASKISLGEGAEVVETYRAPLCRVRVIEAGGEYYYDPQLPVEELSTRERSVLGMVRGEMERGHRQYALQGRGYKSCEGQPQGEEGLGDADGGQQVEEGHGHHRALAYVGEFELSLLRLQDIGLHAH